MISTTQRKTFCDRFRHVCNKCGFFFSMHQHTQYCNDSLPNTGQIEAQQKRNAEIKKQRCSRCTLWCFLSKKKTTNIVTVIMCKHPHFLCQNTDGIPQDSAHDLHRDSKVMGHRVQSVQPPEFSNLSLPVGRQTGNFQIAASFFLLHLFST